MRIIKLGVFYEEKTKICPKCHTEIGYNSKDVIFDDSQTSGFQSYLETGSMDEFETRLSNRYIVCPLCGTKIYVL